MRRIYKYGLEIKRQQSIYMPSGANVLCVGFQDDKTESIIKVWAEVETTNARVKREFRVVGTGHSLSGCHTDLYVGTVFIDAFVWHVFDLGEVDGDLPTEN